MIMLRDNIII